MFQGDFHVHVTCERENCQTRWKAVKQNVIFTPKTKYFQFQNFSQMWVLPVEYQGKIYTHNKVINRLFYECLFRQFGLSWSCQDKNKMEEVHREAMGRGAMGHFISLAVCPIAPHHFVY
jgi:hypothetical protein